MRIMLAAADFRDETFGGQAFCAQHDAIGLAALGHDVVVVTNTGHSTLRAGEVRRGAFRGVPVLHLRTADQLRISGADGEAWQGQIGEAAMWAAGEAAMSAAFRRLLTAARPEVVWCETRSDFGMTLATAVLEAPDGPPLVVAMSDARWLCARSTMVRSNGRRCGQIAIDPAVCATCVASDARTEKWQRHLQVLQASRATVVASSEELREILVASGLAAERVAVVRPARAESPGKVARTPWPGPVRLGFVDGVNDGAGFEQMIRTFQRVARSDYELTVANGTSVFGVREFNVGDWGIPGYVHIAEPFSAETAAGFFDRIDMLVMPSRWQDHFGFTVQAAIDAGVWPVVADGVGAGECVTDGVDGTLMPPDADPAVLAGVITAAIERRSAAAVAEFRAGLAAESEARVAEARVVAAPAAQTTRTGANALLVDAHGTRVAAVEHCLRAAVGVSA